MAEEARLCAAKGLRISACYFREEIKDPRLWAVDVVTFRWVSPPPVLVTTARPTCGRCSHRVHVHALSPCRRCKEVVEVSSHRTRCPCGGRVHPRPTLPVYRFLCATCGVVEDLTLPFRLAMGGDAGWWAARYDDVQLP